MILVLCDENDPSALWAAEALKARGLSPTVLTGAELAAARRWEHRLGSGGASLEVGFEGSVSLRGADVRAVLNRLISVPLAWRRRIGGDDRDYALQEMHAFYLSWLHALPGKTLNPPTPQGLCGNPRHPSAWAALAARVGLPMRPFRQTSEDDPEASWRAAYSPSAVTLHVVGKRTVGPADVGPALRAACLRLSAAAGAPLIGVDFLPDESGELNMINVSIMPELRGGGEGLADALAEELAA